METNIPRDIPWLGPQLDRLLADEARLPHALLLTGRPGLGKSLLAEWLAAALLCEDRRAGARACGRCAACEWVRQGSHPDLRRVTLADEASERPDAAKTKRPSLEIKVDQIRGLHEFLSVGGHRGGRRIVIVDPADALNTVAANALLKSLEEPQQMVMFVLVTGRPQALPATIRSRCQKRIVSAPESGAAVDWLVAGGQSRPEAQRLLAASGGAPLRAARLADADQAAVHRLVVETLSRLPDTSVTGAGEALAKLAPVLWLHALQGWTADLGRLVAQAGAVRHPGEEKRLRALAARTDARRVGSFARWLDQQAQLAAHPMNARLFCEQTLFRYSALFAQDPQD